MSFIYVALALFSIGLYGVLSRRDIIAVLASIEVMLGGATILLVGLSATSELAGISAPTGETSSVALAVLVLAAVEASVGMALMLAVVRRMNTSRLDELNEVRG